ncbi:MAG TPA: hypothetical protein VFS50_09025 [Meiothermus sp.]|nr:hypothetical protein [Meiothermus sp.]
MNLELGSKLVQQHRLERLAQAQTYREAKKRRPGQDHLAELLRGLGDKAARIVSNLRRSLQIELG